MPNSDKPDDFETTIALTSDELETVSLKGEDAVTGRHQPRQVSFPRRDGMGSSLRDRTLPLTYTHDEAMTHAEPFAPPPFPPPPFPPSASSVPLDGSPDHPTPILRSRVEQPIDPPVGSQSHSALAPISTFPPVTVRAPLVPRSVASREAGPAPVAAEASAKAPAWVVGYLVLCVALTLIGLVVLFFEHRMLGNASPL